VTRSSHPPPRHVRYSLRRQVRLDTETHAKLDELAKTFHRKRAQILRYVMQWGLAHTYGWTINPSISDRPHMVHMLVARELCQQVQDAAAAHEVSMAAWLRQVMRQVNPEDFPVSWRAGEVASRSHKSGYFHRKLGLRLDEVISRKLEALMHTFDRPAAAIIRALITQAMPEDFPQSWQIAAMGRRPQDAQPGGGRGEWV